MRKIICFHNPEEINGFLSNWYPSKFNDENGISYTSMEQYMMYQKAMLFKDADIAKKILNTQKAGEIKALGRLVSGFDEKTWSKQKYIIVYNGVLLKFTQNEQLKSQLLSFDENCIFAECAVHDKVWGIGLSMNDQNRFNISCWRGQNLLGKAITQVRDELLNNA